MIFYIVPMIVITINDICAYYVGFLMGKTPLIKVMILKVFIENIRITLQSALFCIFVKL